MFLIPAELGDFDQSRHTTGYVSEFRFLPNQVRIKYSRLIVGSLTKDNQSNGLKKQAKEANVADTRSVIWPDMLYFGTL